MFYSIYFFIVVDKNTVIFIDNGIVPIIKKWVFKVIIIYRKESEKIIFWKFFEI